MRYIVILVLLKIVCAQLPGQTTLLSATELCRIPVVIWHGMGDNCYNEKSMGMIAATIRDSIPGIFVHSICISDAAAEDTRAGFFGILDNQVFE